MFFYPILFGTFFLFTLTPCLLDNVIKVKRKNLLKNLRNQINPLKLDRFMSRVWIGIARALMSIIFLLAGVGKLINWEGTVGSLTTTFSKWYMHLEGMGISGEFHEFLMGSSVVILGIATVLEIAGGLFLLIGYKVRIGAVFLLLFLIPVTFIFHPFWFEVGSEKHVEIGNFFKNLSIIGALIYLLAAPQLKPKNR